MLGESFYISVGDGMVEVVMVVMVVVDVVVVEMGRGWW